MSVLRDLKSELTGAPRKYTIKEDAIPSIFSFGKPTRKKLRNAGSQSCKTTISRGEVDVEEKEEDEFLSEPEHRSKTSGY